MWCLWGTIELVLCLLAQYIVMINKIILKRIFSKVFPWELARCYYVSLGMTDCSLGGTR